VGGGGRYPENAGGGDRLQDPLLKFRTRFAV